MDPSSNRARFEIHPGAILWLQFPARRLIMRFRTIPATLAVLMLATFAVAQTKISGASTCGKPDQQQKIEVGDKAGHAFAISQGKCNWTQPMEIAGIQTKEDVVTTFAEISGARAQAHGVVVGTMSNGDKTHVRIQGTDTYKMRSSKLRTAPGALSPEPASLRASRAKGRTRVSPMPRATWSTTLQANTRFPNKTKG
jgi:hypothetical protein